MWLSCCHGGGAACLYSYPMPRLQPQLPRSSHPDNISARVTAPTQCGTCWLPLSAYCFAISHLLVLFLSICFHGLVFFVYISWLNGLAFCLFLFSLQFDDSHYHCQLGQMNPFLLPLSWACDTTCQHSFQQQCLHYLAHLWVFLLKSCLINIASLRSDLITRKKSG